MRGIAARATLAFDFDPFRSHRARRELGQLETRVATEVLLDRLPRLRLADGQRIVPVVSATVRGTRSLRLAWD